MELSIRNLRLIIIVVLISFGNIIQAQDMERVDAVIQLYPKTFDAPEELSKFISRDFTSEEEKVRAIYSWIIENIIYDPEEYERFNFNFKNYRERNQKEEKTREKVIKRTLQKGVAVCEGYAMLMEKLCELQGIKSYLVRGDTKTNFGDIGRAFNKSHMWNVIIIDDKPYLFDPTWGAGKYNGRFIKDPTYFYYKTPPEQFFKSHYPDIFEDAFVDKNVSRQEFALMPIIIHKELLLDAIENPKSGILRSDAYFGEIPFAIKTSAEYQVSFSYGGEIVPLDTAKTENNRLEFNVPLELGEDKLIIYFDGKPALAYKVR